MVYCDATTFTHDGEGRWVSDRTGETLVELTAPVEDVLAEIDHVLVPGRVGALVTIEVARRPC